jgi:hypothetical protein
MQKTAKGVFCLEGEWHNRYERRWTVKPILELLDQSHIHRIPYIYRDVGTVTELEYYLSKWTLKQYKRFKILYLAFHGQQGAILIGDQRKGEGVVKLAALAEKLAGKCKGRIILISSCSVMKGDKRHLKAFLKTTGAVAICGYSHDVDWMKSAAFDLLAIQAMQENAFLVRGARSIEKRIKHHARGLGLEFRMVINE